MVNILEICLSDLINKKNLLEGELERIVNDGNIETEQKFTKSLELIEKISQVYKSMDLVNTYITKNNTQN
jgi:hypothetical protein